MTFFWSFLVFIHIIVSLKKYFFFLSLEIKEYLLRHLTLKKGGWGSRF